MAFMPPTHPSSHRYSVANSGNGAATGCDTNTAAACGTLTIDGAASSFHLCLAPHPVEADAEAEVKAALPFDAWIGFTDAAAEGTWV